MKYNLRPYQQEVVDLVDNLESGSYLINLATGLGKTVIFASFKRKGKVLVLVHREELAFQAKEKYDCEVGLEMAKYTSNGEDVVIASVQSLVNRLSKFDRNYFDMIIIDEAHHSTALSYRKILDYFKPRLKIGVTATANRADKVRLDDIYQDIIYKKDIRWGVENNYLSDISCIRVNIGYDLSRVSTKMGDYAIGELEAEMNRTSVNKAIAEACNKYSKGQTLIFATSVDHAKNLAEEIDGAVAVTGDTKNRAQIIKDFTDRKFRVLVNCMIFTEGTDMPLVETVVIARPTQSESLYQQMVGRGLRLYPGKDKLTLIDLVGVTGKKHLCTAPSLIGVDMKMFSKLSKDLQEELQGEIFDLPKKISRISNRPEVWIQSVELVDLWASYQKYNTHDINFFKAYDGSLVLNTKSGIFEIPPEDDLGRTTIDGKTISMQKAIDMVYKILLLYFKDEEYIWNLDKIKRWGVNKATDKQLEIISKNFPDFDVESLNKMQASQILNRLFYNPKNAKNKLSIFDYDLSYNPSEVLKFKLA